MSVERVLLVTVSPAREIWVKKARLFRQRLGGFSYAFRTMRMKSVTKSNAIKSLIVISNALLSRPRSKLKGRG